MVLSLHHRTEPNFRFTNSLIVRGYLAQCSGIYLMKEPEGEAALLLSFTEEPQLSEEGEPISLKLSAENARAFGKELIRLTDTI